MNRGSMSKQIATAPGKAQKPEKPKPPKKETK